MKKTINIKHVIISNVITVLVVLSLQLTFQVIAAPNREPVSQSLSVDVLSYQGTLVDNAGDPVSGDTDITFRIYNHPTDPTPLWEEAHTGTNAVPVESGLFSVMLGSLNPIPDSVWIEGGLYLGIQIESDTEMTPREILTNVPRAASSNVAQVALTVADGAVGSRGFAPTWYVSQNDTHYENSSSNFMPTDHNISFYCDVKCTVQIMHQALVKHDEEGGRVDIEIHIDGMRVIRELNYPFGEFGQVNGQGIFNLDEGWHTVSVLFATNHYTPGISTYCGYHSFDYLYVMVFAQE